MWRCRRSVRGAVFQLWLWCQLFRGGSWCPVSATLPALSLFMVSAFGPLAWCRHGVVAVQGRERSRGRCKNSTSGRVCRSRKNPQKSAQGNEHRAEQDRDKKICRREMSATPYTCVMRGVFRKIRKTPIGRRTKLSGEKLTAGRSDHRSRKASSSRRSGEVVKRF